MGGALRWRVSVAVAGNGWRDGRCAKVAGRGEAMGDGVGVRRAKKKPPLSLVAGEGMREAGASKSGVVRLAGL